MATEIEAVEAAAPPHIAQQRAEAWRKKLRAEAESLSDDHWRKMQQEMAAMERERPHCEKCDVVGYVCMEYAATFHKLVAHGLKRCSFHDVEMFAKDFGFEMSEGAAGYARRCNTCRELGPLKFEWIANIPFEAFKRFQIDNRPCYAIDDMKVLVERHGRDYVFPIRAAHEHGQTQDVEGKAFSLSGIVDEAHRQFKDWVPKDHFLEVPANPDFEIRVPVTILPTPVWEAKIEPIKELTLTQKSGGGFEFL